MDISYEYGYLLGKVEQNAECRKGEELMRALYDLVYAKL